MRNSFSLIPAAIAACALASLARPAAASTLFDATLTPAQAGGNVVSTGSGTGTVLLNDAQNQITVNMNYTGLGSAVRAAHIHGPAAPGTSAPIIFPFDLGGLVGGTSGTMAEQTFAITPAQVSDLNAGLYYMNVHTANYPAGEIRGQLVRSTAPIPEPASLALLASGLPAMALLRRRRIA